MQRTRPYKETVMEMLKAKAGFREAFLREGIDSLFDGELDVGVHAVTAQDDGDVARLVADARDMDEHTLGAIDWRSSRNAECDSCKSRTATTRCSGTSTATCAKATRRTLAKWTGPSPGCSPTSRAAGY